MVEKEIVCSSKVFQNNNCSVEVPNSNSRSCSNSSLLECPPAPSREMLVSGWRMEMTLVKSLHSGDPDMIQTHVPASARYSECNTRQVLCG
jgi:hypothetical protein